MRTFGFTRVPYHMASGMLERAGLCCSLFLQSSSLVEELEQLEQRKRAIETRFSMFKAAQPAPTRSSPQASHVLWNVDPDPVDLSLRIRIGNADPGARKLTKIKLTNIRPWFFAFHKKLFCLVRRYVLWPTLPAILVYFYLKVQLFVTAKSDLDPDPHGFALVWLSRICPRPFWLAQVG